MDNFKAISTRYAGPTMRRGSRIIASEPDGRRVVLSYDCALSSTANQRVAAETLRDKLRWNGALIGGATRKGMVWVFCDRETAAPNG